MATDTKRFPLHAILTMRTGRVMGDFGDAQELAEWVMGHPIWTHELPSLGGEIKSRLASQHPELPAELPHVTKENYASVLRDLEEVHGVSLTVKRGDTSRNKSPIETAIETLGADRVVAV